MFGIPNFDLLSDSGKQGFVEYIVNLVRKEIISYSPAYTVATGEANIDLSPYATVAQLISHEADTTNVHGIVDTSDLVTQNTSYLDFDTVSPGTDGEGILLWSIEDGGLIFGGEGGLQIPIGQKNVIYVKNGTGSDIPKGKAVMATGASGDRINIDLAVADGSIDARYMLGVTAELIEDDSFGFVVTNGYVRKLNTNAWPVGTVLHFDSANPGELTSSDTTAPNLDLPIAIVTKQNSSSGIIYVRMKQGEYLKEVHDVSINAATLANGDIIKYNSSIGVWENVAADDIPAHASTHGASGSDPVTIDPSQVTGTAVITSDARLSDERTPLDASVTSTKFNIDYASAPTVTQEGALYYNTTSDKLFVWDGSAWDEVGAGGGVPVGTIIWYAENTPPTGFLLCDGSSQLRTAYPDLFDVIGTTYGDGSTPGTTFALPNVPSTTGIYVISTQLAPTVYTSDALFTAPIGAMIQWPITSGYPTGWLRSDGTAISRTTYSDLFGVIGTTYGSGDGSTTFNLPNLLASGTGSPVYIIKATLSGTVEPSTVSHAASHIRGGADVIDADRTQIDFVPSYYTRDSTASEAGANTDLTAHLKGLDNNFERIRVDSSGRVTLPYQPAFNAYGTTTFNSRSASDQSAIPFDSTTLNVGNHYDTSNGRFTAPIDGVYFFAANLRLDSTAAGGYLRYGIKRNNLGNGWNTQYGHAHAIQGNNHSTDYNTLPISTVMYMNANDYVWCWCFHVSSSGSVRMDESNFSGCLLY